MITRSLAFATITVGIIAFVTGVYGVIGPEFSVLMAGLGLLVLLCGIAFLLFATSPWQLSAPHPYVIGMVIIATVLHAYENTYKSSDGPSVGLLLWSMVPYGLCFMLSMLPVTRLPVIAGTALALAFDLFGYYSVFVNPQSSTAALALLFIPLWSAIIVVPLATFISWSVARKHKGTQGNSP